MKTITLKRLEKMQPCLGGLDWYKANFTKGSYPVSSVIKKLMSEDRFQWSNWFIVRCMTHPQQVRYAIFAAEQVIEIYEKKHPTDDRPRKAIQAARAYLKSRTEENRLAAHAAYAANAAAKAAYAANAAAYAANAAAKAAYAANAAAYAAYAAAKAAYAANAAAYAANAAAYAAYAAAKAVTEKELQTKIIKFGLKLI
jgi:hypothetical protein